MLQGHLDTIFSSGMLEGWAVDPDAPLDPVEVLIECDDGTRVAEGPAQLFRADLSAAGVGTGWCAFRLRTFLSVSRLSRSTIVVMDATTRGEIHRVARPPIREGHEPTHRSVEAVLTNDPTIIADIDMLDGCGPMFDAFMAARGAEAFVRAAYVYVFGRPADDVGITLYGRMLFEQALTPFALLKVLADSDEFKSGTRLLAAPPSRGFPFRT